MSPAVEGTCIGPPDLHYSHYVAPRPALLLLHGVTRDRSDWEPLLPELSKRWRVIALDHRGHGKSGWASGAYYVRHYAMDAARFVREHFTEDEPVCVMGHSLGAMVALWLAVECPDLIPCAILEDPPFHTMGRRIGSTPFQAQFAGFQQVARQGGTVEEMTDRLAEIRLPTAQGTKRLGELRDRDSLRFSAGCLSRIDPEVLTPVVAGQWLEGFDYESYWSRVGCPMLLLQGDPHHGGVFADADVESARRDLALSWLERFAGVGHQIHRSAPKKVIEILDEFTSFEGPG